MSPFLKNTLNYLGIHGIILAIDSQRVQKYIEKMAKLILLSKMFIFGKSEGRINGNFFYYFCNFSKGRKLFKNKFKSYLYHTIPYFLLLRQQNYFYFSVPIRVYEVRGGLETTSWNEHLNQQVFWNIMDITCLLCLSYIAWRNWEYTLLQLSKTLFRQKHWEAWKQDKKRKKHNISSLIFIYNILSILVSKVKWAKGIRINKSNRLKESGKWLEPFHED